MKRMRIPALLGAFLLCLALPACQTAEQPPASSAPSSQARAPAPSVPEGISSAASSRPEPASSLPPDFDEIWAENPIEEALQEDLDLVNNFDDIVLAYMKATERWARLIPIAFEDCLAVLPPEDQEAFQADQEKWKAELDEKLAGLESSLDELIEGKEAAARRACGLYEERAYSLCKRKFCADGVMPSFEEAMKEPEAAG